MALFNASVPADTEAVSLGAFRIRSLLATLNTLLGKVFSAVDGTFQAQWIDGTQIQSDSTTPGSDDNRAVGTDHIKSNAVTGPKIAALTSGDLSRIIPLQGIVGTMLSNSIVYPAGTVGTAALAPGAVQGSAILDGGVGIGKLATGVVLSSIGSYAGSNSASAVVTGLPFTPTAVILFQSGAHGFGFSTAADGGNIHESWMYSGISNSEDAATGGGVTFTTNGFTVNAAGFFLNKSGETTYYVALRL